MKLADLLDEAWNVHAVWWTERPDMPADELEKLANALVLVR